MRRATCCSRPHDPAALISSRASAAAARAEKIADSIAARKSAGVKQTAPHFLPDLFPETPAIVVCVFRNAVSIPRNVTRRTLISSFLPPLPLPVPYAETPFSDFKAAQVLFVAIGIFIALSAQSPC